MFPSEFLDGLGIPEAQPVELGFAFSGTRVWADTPPKLEVLYCGHGRTRQLHEQCRPEDITPHDK